MGIVIAIFITLVVAGSILWVKPSRRDVRIADIRRKAMSHGIRVRLLDEKLVRSMFPWLSDHRGLSIYENHNLDVPVDREMRVFRVNGLEDLHELDRLNFDELERKISSYDMPDGIEAIVVYPTGVGLLWNEQGDESAVDALSELLQLVNREYKAA